MTSLILPRGYCSYSQYNLWKRSPTQYRTQYFDGVKPPRSKALDLGSKTALLFEQNAAELSSVPRFSLPEYKLETFVDDVPVLGYIDSYEPSTGEFIEMKTGAIPWDRVKVQKHEQLDFYALMLNKIEGVSRERDCILIWLPTEKVQRELNGKFSDDYDLKLTGVHEVFHRTITLADIDYIHHAIVKVAHEIASDYQTYLSTNL